YTIVCAFVGFAVVSIITLRRNLRGKPAVLVSDHTETLDVAEQLGFKPAGRGMYRLLANLPGNEVFKVDFVDRVLHLPQLPAAWDGLTILHLSDLHFHGTPDRDFFQ